MTRLGQRASEGDGEGRSLIVAADVTLQTVLAAEGLLAAVARAVEGLLACEGIARATRTGSLHGKGAVAWSHRR